MLGFGDPAPPAIKRDGERKVPDGDLACVRSRRGPMGALRKPGQLFDRGLSPVFQDPPPNRSSVGRYTPGKSWIVSPTRAARTALGSPLCGFHASPLPEAGYWYRPNTRKGTRRHTERFR
eukprot:gene15094-biopygen5399